MHEYKKVTIDYLDSAPRKMEFVVQLPVSCEALFSIFKGRDTWQWAGIEDVIWDSEPPYNANTKRTIVQQTGSRLNEQFLVWEQDRRMVFRIDSGDVGLLGALLEDYSVKPVGDDECEFTWTIAYELRGWASFFSPLLSVLVRQLFKKMVKDFEQMVANHRADQ